MAGWLETNISFESKLKHYSINSNLLECDDSSTIFEIETVSVSIWAMSFQKLILAKMMRFGKKGE